jgi:hypothetical protein
MVNLPIEYSDKPVTPFGGMALMKRFIDQTGVREHLATLDLPQGGSNRAYDPVQIIESFWLGIWTGASRCIHCNWLRQDQTIAAIFGYGSLPSQSTYSRFFGKFSQARNTAVFPPLQQWFFSQINVGAVTVDFDSTVITRDGSQEGSAKGYNPNRKGRNSHHPLLAFISQTRMVANALLRPGNTAACSNCVEFMRETFDEAMSGVKVGLVRGDSGFYTDEILSTLEERRLNYIIAARAYANLKKRNLRHEGLGGSLSRHRSQRVAASARRSEGPKRVGTSSCASRSADARRPGTSCSSRICPTTASACMWPTSTCRLIKSGTSTTAERTANRAQRDRQSERLPEGQGEAAVKIGSRS